MWCAQTLMLMNPMRDRRRHHDRIAENRLARKHRHDFGDEREGRNDQHVDLRMSEDPEEVHPDHRRAARLRVEEMSAQVAVDHQHDLRRRERAHGDQHHARHHQIQPRQQRHLLRASSPGSACTMMVAMILIAVPMLPKPETSRLRGSSSPCCARAKTHARSAARTRTIPRPERCPRRIVRRRR